MEALNQIFQAASQEMYAQSNEAGAEDQAPEAEPVLKQNEQQNLGSITHLLMIV
jgi:hypothetical protein